MASLKTTTMSSDNSTCTRGVTINVDTEPLVRCSSELYKTFHDASVSISVVPKFSIAVMPAPPTTSPSGLPVAPGFGETILYPLLPVVTSGFFLEREGFIVGSSGFLQTVIIAIFLFYLFYLSASVSGVAGTPVAIPTLASLTAAFPLATSAQIAAVASLYTLPVPGVLPTIDTVLSIIFNPTAPQGLADFFDIFITVFNVNGCGLAYVYRGYIAGVDFDTGLAIYKIDKCDLWNKCNPVIKSHPFLKFATSKCSTPGSPAHILASYINHSPQSFASGSIAQNVDIISDGTITYEAINTDIVVQLGVEGAPILDQCGFVVGVVTGINSTAQTAFGVSSSFAREITSKLIEGHCKPNCTDYVLYNDIFGFNIYRHGVLGLSYTLRNGTDIGVLGADVVYPPPIDRFYNEAYCRINRQLVGLLVRAVTGSLAQAVEECSRQNFPVFTTTKVAPPTFPTEIGIQPLDLITGIAGNQVGQLPYQLNPDTLLYQLTPCSTLNIEFMKASESYTQCHCLCTALDDSLAWLFNIPPVYQILTTGAVPPPVAAGTGLPGVATISAQLLLYFFNALPEVYRATFINQLLAISGVAQNGGTTIPAPLSTGLPLFVRDFLNQITIQANSLVSPASGFDLKYLSLVNTNVNAFPLGFNTLISLLTPLTIDTAYPVYENGGIGFPIGQGFAGAAGLNPNVAALIASGLTYYGGPQGTIPIPGF